MTDSSTALTRLLDSFREGAQTKREMGRYFEDLALVYFRKDAKQKSCYEHVWTYAQWAQAYGREYGHDPSDIGIDLVAKLRGEVGYCAIQAKFYEPGRPLRKADIDSFIAASDGTVFTQRAVVDSSGKDFGKNLQNTIGRLRTPFTRIRLVDLERSSIDWSSIPIVGEIRDEDAAQKQPKTPREHQTEAVAEVRTGLEKADRGQIVMACGTGKTYTAQLVAEESGCKQVLVLVPSLALVSQTVAEWCQDAATPIRALAVCSDRQVGKRRVGGDDSIQYDIHDLAFPATTDARKLAERMQGAENGQVTVVFSTYHSLDVISKAQLEHGLPRFDLAICDEAHRTTGQIDADEEGSNFVRIHDAAFLHADKRLYMTATPRIYTDVARSKAYERSTTLCTMDDTSTFGEVLFYRGFDWAIRNGLLSDYRVIVLALDEDLVSSSIQRSLAADNELQLSDAVKILGSYKALMKHSVDPEEFADDPAPARRAMAFSNKIEESKRIRREFDSVVREYHAHYSTSTGTPDWHCDVEHVDGSTGATEREERLRWLSAGDETGESCRILSNVRCLGEGVDVPALDAVLFLHPRKSQIDVVQAVGRVMRRAAGKKRGYVILPIGVPAGVPPEQALADNEKYRVIWQIVNALKSHDERLEAQINATSFGEDMPGDKIRITVGNLVETAPAGLTSPSTSGGNRPPPPSPEGEKPVQGILDLKDEIAEAVYARIVKRCGARDYWEDWATDVQKIARDHIARIDSSVSNPRKPENRKLFKSFLAELQDDLNPSITAEQAMEMLAQHLITRPVFDAIFAGNAFTQQNSVSRAMQRVVDMLDAENIGKESASLRSFYASVERRAKEVTTAAGKQNLIRQLYESFFRKSFGKISEQLGIVYTPVEAVDYILHTVDGVLQEEFGLGLNSRGVKLLDPFTGTGTFLVRAIEAGPIPAEDLSHKYRQDLYANEIVPLAYYIAGINIENAYHSAAGCSEYEPFENLCLTDTFQFSQHKGSLSDLFPLNQERIDRQADLDFLAVVGNPPYSAGQRSANDNAANVAYPHLDKRIEETYAKGSTAQLKNSLYDSYIRAIRWASDRIGNRGVIGFVTNGGWLDGGATTGLRRCLREEFGSLYVINMRGDQRTSGELSRREGGKLFGTGSRAPIAISVFVKNPDKSERGVIHYHDIGDYLTREEKLARLAAFASGEQSVPWRIIKPDAYGDWINQRDPGFDTYMRLGDKKTKGVETVFRLYSNGLKTNRDAWCYNASRAELESNVRRSLEFYNGEVERYARDGRIERVDDFIEKDPKQFSWDEAQRKWVEQGRRIDFDPEAVRVSMYRPFTRRWGYFHRTYNNRVYQLPAIFPQSDSENRLICTTSIGDKRFSTLMVSVLPDLHLIGAAQCFPRYAYSKDHDGKIERHSNITDSALRAIRDAHPECSDKIDADVVFHYIYGLMHSPDYTSRFGKNLLKQLPRIPFVERAEDFFAFAEAGKALGELHANYEQAAPFPTVTVNGAPLDHAEFVSEDYRVTKMRFAGKRGSQDRSTVVYNHRIRISGIPEDAHEYSVNGKTPIEWVMDRQRVSTHKASGIANDANRYATETARDPAYPFILLLRAVTVGVETSRIVRNLPPLLLT